MSKENTTLEFFFSFFQKIIEILQEAKQKHTINQKI